MRWAGHALRIALLTAATFRRIKQIILECGDRQTYCSRYNRNPHIAVDGIDAYLNPEDWHNINCDPERSDFDEFVIRLPGRPPQHLHVRLQGEQLHFEISQADALVRCFAVLQAAGDSE